MQNFAFAPEGFDTEANLDILVFVPKCSDTWSTEHTDSGFVARARNTGELFAYLPFGTVKLPTFNEEDKEAAFLAARDIQSGAAFG